MTDRVLETGRIPLRVSSLDNGLRVLVHEARTAPLVSVWCWYKVGSKDETPGRTGVSHWVEHMNFKGSRNIPRDQVKGLVERYGGTWNGYTWIDQTAYYETAASDALDQLLFIEAERMANCLYDPEDVEAERTVIISELQGAENDPEQLLDVEVTSAAYKAHPYGNPTIGWLGDLQTMSRDELYAHYRQYYTPENAVLVVAGDVDADRVFRRAEHYFRDVESRPRPSPFRGVEPAQLGERRVAVEREGTTAYLKVACHAPAADDPEFFPMLVLDAVLTGAKGLNLWSSFRGAPPQRQSRLYRALVDSGLASSVAGALLPTEHPFLYTISATATTGTPLIALEQTLAEELDRVVAGGVTERELARARRQLRARFAFEIDSVTNVAHQIGHFETVATVDTYFGGAARVDQVSAADVARVAARLAPARRTVGWFVPTRPR